MEILTVRYEFVLADGSQVDIDLKLDADSLQLQAKTPEPPPAWTELACCQCANCPLDLSGHQYCPLALNLVEIVRHADRLVSYEEVHVKVITAERRASQDTTAQRAISSLMGFVIATSGCPHAGFLKPMARFHLPLASREETMYRATSMYMLAQYFLKKEGRDIDLEMAGLAERYRNLHTINLALAERLRIAAHSDSSVNAIILLDIYTRSLPKAIHKSMDNIRRMFAAYFADNGPLSS